MPLTKEEEARWIDVNNKIAKVAKSKRAKKLVKLLESHAPTLAYVWVAGSIFVPRAMMAAQDVKERRAAAREKERARKPQAPADLPHKSARMDASL